MGGFAWVTLATNDSYSLGALVLGHALKQAGTIGRLVVLVTPGVTPPMRAKLSAVFNIVQEVNILDSKDESNLRLLKRPELGVTFTKLHCWRLTQFDKCVFLDADTLILSNCDELFQRDEFSAAPDVGWPDCFNSGVFVFKPSNDTYESLIKFALENGSFDGGDQGLLNLFFSDWAHKDINKRLPFIYNMCSIASYSYLPAFKQFGGQVKIVHFIGVTKPWLQYFDTESKKVEPASGTEHLKQHLQLWWNIFCAQVHPVLTTDMEGLASAFAQFTLGSRRSESQSAMEDHLRRQCWEVGNIDYLGRDSFANIWSKISETMAGGQPKVDRKEEQIAAQTDSAPVAPPKPISAPEIPVSANPDAVQQKLEQRVQAQQTPTVLKVQSEGPPVTLKDILRPTQPTPSLETCEKAAISPPVPAEIRTASVCEPKPADRKAVVCEAILAEAKLSCETKPAGVASAVCESTPAVSLEAKPAEIASLVCETKPAASPIPMAPASGPIEQPSIILAEGQSVVAAPICEIPPKVCEKPASLPQTPPVCQKEVPVCEKAPAVCEKPASAHAPAPICEKPIGDKPATVCTKAPVCEKRAEVTEKSEDKKVPIPDQIPANVPTSTPAPLPIEASINSAVPETPAPATIPLGPAVKEESKPVAPFAVCTNPVAPAETADKPVVAAQPEDKLVTSANLQSPAAGPIEKLQEPKLETPAPTPPQQESNGNGKNKINKKNNKNGKQDGKLQQHQQQQQQPKSEKGNNKPVAKEVKQASDVPVPTEVKTDDKSAASVPLSGPILETAKTESDLKLTSPIPMKDEKIQEKVKDAPVPIETEHKASEEPIKALDAHIVSSTPQEGKGKKNDKNKKDNAQGDKKVDKTKDQKSDNGSQDKKKGGEKQEKKPEQQEKKLEQGQNKNGKKGANKDKGKKETDQKSDEKVEQKTEIKSELKPESKPVPTQETKEIRHEKAEVKQEEKVESKPQPDTKVGSKDIGKQGKDGKSDDKKKGGKEQKQQAPSPPKEKGKEQPPAGPKQAADTPKQATGASKQEVALPTTPITPVEVEATKKAVDPASEKPSSPTPQKQTSGDGKKETAPTPPPRKGNNGSKKGKKK